MIGATNSYGASASQYSRMFQKIDANSDGSVSKSEFVTGAPSDISAEQAESLFDTLDSKKTGALSESDLTSAFQQMSSTMQSALIFMQDVGEGGHGKPPDFSELDTDGNGSLSREEFVAGRPDDVSEEDAGSLFDSIAGDSDSVTEQQLADGMKKMGPPPGANQEEETDSAASAQDKLLQSLLEAISTYQKSAYSASAVTATASIAA